jgi:hypothetical protein
MTSQHLNASNLLMNISRAMVSILCGACSNSTRTTVRQKEKDLSVTGMDVGLIESLDDMFVDDEEKLLNFDPAYDAVITEILDQNLNIAWKYYLKKENYEKVYLLLKSLLPTVENLHTRKVKQGSNNIKYVHM